MKVRAAALVVFLLMFVATVVFGVTNMSQEEVQEEIASKEEVEEIEQYLEKSGKPSDMYIVGAMFMTGKNRFPKDLEKGAKWISRSAEQGDKYGQFSFGEMHELGWGVQQDGKKALAWYTKAADQGLDSAPFALAQMYEYGKAGVTPDRAKAVRWYTEGAARGCNVSKKALERLK